MRARAMTRADLPRVLAIARASLPEAWTLEGFDAEIDAPSSASLVLGEPAIGYAIGSIAAGELEVRSIAVDPIGRRRGAGAALLAALIEHARARGAVDAHLEVRIDNVAAIALYARAGFVRGDVRARYYADGTDALLMSAVLAS
jgi:ribosomal-protein-alanine N-acetyltransferase